MKTREDFIREARKRRAEQVSGVCPLPKVEPIGAYFRAQVAGSEKIITEKTFPNAQLLNMGVGHSYLLARYPDIIFEVWYTSEGVFAIRSSIDDAAGAYWRAVECRKDQLRRLVDLRAQELAQLRKALAEVEIIG